MSCCRGSETFTPMNERRESGVVAPAVVGDERVGLRHRIEPRADVAGLIGEFGGLFEVPVT